MPSVGAPSSRSCRSLFVFIPEQNRVRRTEQAPGRGGLAAPRLDELGYDPLVGENELTLPGEHVVVRYDGTSSFGAQARHPPRSGRDRRGRVYQESWGWLGGPRNRHRCYVRRLVLERPGDKPLIVLTDLLDSQAYPAADVLEIYRQRWGIERVFQVITEVFQLQHLIGSTPQGTLFQLALCLWWYNLIQVVRA